MKTLKQLEALIAQDRAAGGTNNLADAGGWLLAARKNHFPGAFIGRCRWWWWILRSLRIEPREALDLLERAHRMEEEMWGHVGSAFQRIIEELETGRTLTKEERTDLRGKLEALLGDQEQREAAAVNP